MFDKLYSELCSHIENESKFMREEKAGAVPWIVAIMSSWVISQIRTRTCEQKDVIIEAVMKYVDIYVTNAAIRQMILVALDTASEALCPVVPPTQ